MDQDFSAGIMTNRSSWRCVLLLYLYTLFRVLDSHPSFIHCNGMPAIAAIRYYAVTSWDYIYSLFVTPNPEEENHARSAGTSPYLGCLYAEKYNAPSPKVNT